MLTHNHDFRMPADHEPLCPRFVGTPIDRLFDRVAERRAGHIAIDEPARRWTYRELQQHVCRIAVLLARLGAAGQERPVALYLPTGAPLLAAMLATLKAGGFYVVIEPDHPPERNAVILEDSGAQWVMTDEEHEDAVAARFPDHRILLWNEAAAGSTPDVAAIEPHLSRAAIVYTSGSSGRPKGVLHSQAFILNWTRLYASDLRLAPSDRVGLLYSASVAGAIRDIFGALLTGATLLPLAPREQSFNRLAERLCEGRVSVYHSVPTLFRHLVGSQSAVAQFPGVRVVAFGGERVLGSDLSLLRERFLPDTMIYTSIGSTEAATYARLFLRADSEPGDAVVPLGVPPAGTRVVLVGPDGTPVANGEAGEIVVESRHLADGYWRCPEATAAAFSAAASGGAPRRFRTGDVARQDHRGLLCHVGRSDAQFKRRGYRVEAAEVEAVLMSGLQLSNVIVRPEQGNGEGVLAAYLESAHACDLPTLRRYCARRLPEYMIPDSFQVYERFPRLPNGKVDIQRLRRVPRRIALTYGRDIDLRDAATLRDAWRAIFPGIDVTEESDFFAEGGDSLTAMRLMNRVKELYGLEQPVTLLFRHPTLGAFERALQDARRGQSREADVTSKRCRATPAVRSGDSSCAAPAQTILQLSEQLLDAGCAPSRLKAIFDAHDLAQTLFPALLRPEGKPFVNHLVGTASILTRYGAPFPVVAAGLLHAAYTFGEFATPETGITPARRRRVRAVVGEEAEDLVHRYARFPWNAATIGSLPQKIPCMSRPERDVVLMRLANELEEATDVSSLSGSSARRLLKLNYLGLSAAIARAMAMEDLAAELEANYRRGTVCTIDDDAGAATPR